MIHGSRRKANATAFAALLVIAGICLVGCTHRQGYEFVRATGEAKARCERALSVADQRACEAEYQQSYEAYRAARREVLEDAAAEGVP